MPTDLRILLAVPQEAAQHFAEPLRQAGYTGDWQYVETRETCLATLQTASFDLVILDGGLPWCIEAVRALRGRGSNMPIIAAALTPDVQTAVACIKNGMDDYTDLAGLGGAVSRALAVTEAAPQSAENQALENERRLNGIKNHLLSRLSHDLRTPLSVILTTSELLQRYLDRLTEERRNAYFDAIHHQIKLMDHRLDDISAVIRAETGRLDFSPTLFDLGDLCQDVLDETRLTIGGEHTISFQAAEGLPEVPGDPRLVRMVLRNLLSNAIKYSSREKEIRLEADYQAGQAVFVRVRDGGIGIPEADQPRLFEPYYRAGNVQDISGAGIGLRLAKYVADLHGGSLTFTSQEGVGSTFVLALPLAERRD